MTKAKPKTAPANGEAVALPHGWRWCRLGDLVERIDYGFTASADFAIKEPRFLRITDIQNDKVEWDKVPGCNIADAQVDANRLFDGDIVFARTGATTGKSFLVSEPPFAVFASYLIRLRVKQLVQPEFLWLFFQSEHYWKQIREKARGGIQPNFNATMLAVLPVIVPPLTEQRRIAARLREQLTEVAQARAAIAAQLAAAQALPSAHLRAVFESDVAKQWPKRRVDQIISRPLRTGLSKLTSASADKRCLTLSAVRDGILNFAASKPVAATDHEARANAVKPGVFYVVRGNGNISLVARGALAPTPLPSPALFPDLLIELQPNPAVVLPHYLRWVWDSPKVRHALEARSMTSTGIYKINLTNLSTVEIPVPTIPQQEAIIERCQAASHEQTALRQRIADRLAALDQLPAALLREAFEGA